MYFRSITHAKLSTCGRMHRNFTENWDCLQQFLFTVVCLLRLNLWRASSTESVPHTMTANKQTVKVYFAITSWTQVSKFVATYHNVLLLNRNRHSGKTQSCRNKETSASSSLPWHFCCWDNAEGSWAPVCAGKPFHTLYPKQTLLLVSDPQQSLDGQENEEDTGEGLSGFKLKFMKKNFMMSQEKKTKKKLFFCQVQNLKSN